MSQRTKLGLALGNREGQVWGAKKIVIPKDELGDDGLTVREACCTNLSTSVMIRLDQ